MPPRGANVFELIFCWGAVGLLAVPVPLVSLALQYRHATPRPIINKIKVGGEGGGPNDYVLE